jgi:hypothetical protein
MLFVMILSVGVQCFIFTFDDCSGGVLGSNFVAKVFVSDEGENCLDCCVFCLCLGG